MSDFDSRNEQILEAIINETEYTDPPQSRNEAILKSILDETEYTEEPQSRIEDLLLQLKEKIEQGGGGDAATITELCCLNCYGKAWTEIPYMTSLPQYNDYADYLRYNTSTRKFEVLQDFTAVLTGWVRNYDRASSTFSEGRTRINDVDRLSYQVNTLMTGAKAGKTGIFSLKVGDTVYPYTPNSNGYPEQHLKIYKIEPKVEITPTIEAFADEGAST